MMTKKDYEDFESSSMCWNCDNSYVGADVKVRDHCNITGKHRGSAHRDCNIRLKLYHKNSSRSPHLKKIDAHLIMLELAKVDFKINVISNELEKYMSFSINNKLVFIDSFQFLRSSLDSLVNNFEKYDFQYLSQESDGELLDLVKQKGFYPNDYMSD